MEALLDQISAVDALSLGAGLLLLLLGRRLFWLALAALGFLFGLLLADHAFALETAAWRLGLGFLLGVLGGVLAVLAQKIAVSVAGLLAGAYGGWRLAELWAPPEGFWLLAAALLGAVLGAILSSVVFESALIIVSSLAGAFLAAGALPLDSKLETWIFLGLLCVGVMAQSRSRERRRARAAAG